MNTENDRQIDDLIEIATHAPSVGFSQPWRFVKVGDPARRRAVWESFSKANEKALQEAQNRVAQAAIDEMIDRRERRRAEGRKRRRRD